MKHGIHIYLYADNMVIEGIKLALLAHNQGSTLFADGDTPNAIVTYNFWQGHSLSVVDPDGPRHFRLDMINQEQLLALKDT